MISYWPFIRISIASLIIINFLWNLLAIPLALFFSFIPQKIKEIFVPILWGFIVSSPLVALTHGHVMEQGLSLYLLVMITTLMIFIFYGQTAYEKKKELFGLDSSINLSRDDKASLYRVYANSVLIIPIVFIVLIIFPFFAVNSLTMFLLQIIELLLNIPILGLIIKVLTILVFLNYIFRGFVLIFYGVVSVIRKLSKVGRL